MSSYVCLVLLIAIAGELVGRHQSTAITVDEHPTLPANLSHLLTMVGSDELRKLLQDTSFTECVKVSFALQSKKSNKFLRAKKKGAVDARGRSWRPRGGHFTVKIDRHPQNRKIRIAVFHNEKTGRYLAVGAGEDKQIKLTSSITDRNKFIQYRHPRGYLCFESFHKRGHFIHVNKKGAVITLEKATLQVGLGKPQPTIEQLADPIDRRLLPGLRAYFFVSKRIVEPCQQGARVPPGTDKALKRAFALARKMIRERAKVNIEIIATSAPEGHEQAWLRGNQPRRLSSTSAAPTAIEPRAASLEEQSGFHG